MSIRSNATIRILGPLCTILLGLDAHPANGITLLTQERTVLLDASSGAPDSQSFSSFETGAFSASGIAFSSYVVCLPFGGKCVTYFARAEGNQDSLIATTADGALEIRVHGSTAASLQFVGEAQAASRLTSSFLVASRIPYVIQANGSGNARVVLEDEHGAFVEYHDLSGSISETGHLTPGIYTLSIQASAEASAETDVPSSKLDVRFTAGKNPGVSPRCVIQLSQPSYAYGDVVTALVLRVENPRPEPVPVELKIWLRLPDGLTVPAKNTGADGSLVVPGATSQEFGPQPLMGVDTDTASGLYEFGCRVLDPQTGKLFSEDSDLFEIQ